MAEEKVECCDSARLTLLLKMYQDEVALIPPEDVIQDARILAIDAALDNLVFQTAYQTRFDAAKAAYNSVHNEYTLLATHIAELNSEEFKARILAIPAELDAARAPTIALQDQIMPLYNSSGMPAILESNIPYCYTANAENNVAKDVMKGNYLVALGDDEFTPITNYNGYDANFTIQENTDKTFETLLRLGKVWQEFANYGNRIPMCSRRDYVGDGPNQTPTPERDGHYTINAMLVPEGKWTTYIKKHTSMSFSRFSDKLSEISEMLDGSTPFESILSLGRNTKKLAQKE